MNSLFGIPKEINKVDVRIQMNKMISEARKIAKPQKCILCNKEKTSFAIHILSLKCH